ncbi:hypothetical protein D8B45_03465 [Candidatus Gracilibacteria bacterium]|nr:MAG: hypothetical protein D8B45_03465 [Candidatus Gracilibacteria bacterium]
MYSREFYFFYERTRYEREHPGFWNGAYYYEDSIGDDKDWVYFRDDMVSDLSINSVKKAANFKVEVFLNQIF